LSRVCIGYCAQASFYLVGLVFFLYLIQDDRASAVEAALLVSIYFGYVGLVVYLYMTGREVDHHAAHKSIEGASFDGLGEEEEEMLLLAASDPATAEAGSAGVPPSPVGPQRRGPTGDLPPAASAPVAVKTALFRAGASLVVNSEKMFFFTRPVIEFVIPPLKPQLKPSSNTLYNFVSGLSFFAQPLANSKHDVSLYRVASIFFVSVALIGVFSSQLLMLVQYSLTFLPLDASTVSATLMSLGAEVRVLMLMFYFVDVDVNANINVNVPSCSFPADSRYHQLDFPRACRPLRRRHGGRHRQPGRS
jgi:Ca2+/Na+ antiporter